MGLLFRGRSKNTSGSVRRTYIDMRWTNMVGLLVGRGKSLNGFSGAMLHL